MQELIDTFNETFEAAEGTLRENDAAFKVLVTAQDDAATTARVMREIEADYRPRAEGKNEADRNAALLLLLNGNEDYVALRDSADGFARVVASTQFVMSQNTELLKLYRERMRFLTAIGGDK